MSYLSGLEPTLAQSGDGMGGEEDEELLGEEDEDENSGALEGDEDGDAGEEESV